MALALTCSQIGLQEFLQFLLNTEQHCTTISLLSTSDHLGITLVLTWKLPAANHCNTQKI